MKYQKKLDDLTKETKDKINVLRRAGETDEEIDEEFHEFNSKFDEIKYEIKIIEENNAFTPEKESEYIKKLTELLEEIKETIKRLNIG